MAESLYISSLEKGSGKLVITLGVMELLSRKVERLGFFRPVIPGDGSFDNDIELIRHRYNVCLSPEQMVGLSHDEAHAMIAAGDEQRIYRTIISRYNEALSNTDFLLCEGPNISSLSEAFDYDISIRIARELGTPTLYVSSGRRNNLDEIVRNIQVAEQTIRQYNCELLAVIVNRTDPDQLQVTVQAVQKALKNTIVAALPETVSLRQPTVEDIVTALHATHYSGPADLGQRNVADIKVAAMSINNYLHLLAEDDLVITPGDRPDIILATLAAIISQTCPSAAALILSGNLFPGPDMQNLLTGLNAASIPIYSVPGDTFRTAMQAGEVPGIIRPGNQQKIATALGLFEAHVDTETLEQKIIHTVSTTISPLMFEYELFQRARKEKQHIVLPEGSDDRILQAAELLRLRDVVELTILGNENRIRNRAAQLGLKLKDVPIIDPQNSSLREDYATTLYELRKGKGMTKDYAYDRIADVSYFGTMMVYKDMADGMVSGAAHTTQHTIQPAFQFIKTAPEALMVSSVFFMCFATKVLVYGDCAVNPNPNSEELAEIAISSANTAAMFNIKPVVAMLSYSSGNSGKGSDVDLVREAATIARRRRPDLKIDGPIQYDAAIDATVAKKKMPDSEVAGKATVLIFPDLNTGNNTYKAVQRSSGAVAIGPVLQGLRKPVNDLSRGCLVADIINTVAITAIQAQAAGSADGPLP